jgi:transposase
MGRSELERLSKDELIDLVLRLQRPEKTSRTSSKPPSTDRKEQREKSKPGGAKPGHQGHSRTLSERADRILDHVPEQCPCCQTALASDLPAEPVSVHDRIELPEVKPEIERHRRLAVRCPACGSRVVADVPSAARGTPFGPRLHAVATYLKTFQALSYERLQGALADLFGLTISQGGLMNLLRRAQGRFQAPREDAVAALRRAAVVASDETGVRIEGANDRGRKRGSLGVSLPRRRRSSSRADARRLGDPGDDGRPSPCGLALRSLFGPAGPCGSAADLPGPSRPRRRLCA